MLVCKFEGWISRSNTNGGVFYCPGVRTVYVAEIPEGAPQDWSMGPKQIPEEFGAFLEHLYYPERHGPYAFVTAKTEIEAAQKAQGFFRERRSEWERIL